jgi:hypothetical protein
MLKDYYGSLPFSLFPKIKVTNAMFFDNVPRVWIMMEPTDPRGRVGSGSMRVIARPACLSHVLLER